MSDPNLITNPTLNSPDITEGQPLPVRQHLPGHITKEMKLRWSKISSNAIERIPSPYLITIVLAGLLALGEQLIEFMIEKEVSGSQAYLSPVRLVVLPLLVVYLLAHFAIVKRSTINALVELRPIVLVSDEEYETHVKRMVSVNGWVESVLFLVSIIVSLILFVGLGADLLNTNSSLPASLPVAIYIIFIYVFLGWLLLELVYKSLRQATALFALTRRPLVINIFDPVHLIPFGRLGLILSLPIVGIVLVPLILFGAPTMGGYLVILLSGISFLALFVPLWGVHQQIVQAQDRTTTEIHNQLQEIHNKLIPASTLSSAELDEMTSRLNLLINLRKTVSESPTWPFKNSAEVTRAVIAVTSPLIYFILNELIRTYVLPLISGGSV